MAAPRCVHLKKHRLASSELVIVIRGKFKCACCAEECGEYKGDAVHVVKIIYVYVKDRLLRGFIMIFFNKLNVQLLHFSVILGRSVKPIIG